MYCQGFTDEDLLDFELKLSNPSTIAQQQKLELFRTRFEVAASALQTPGLVDRHWVQKNIMRLSEEEVKSVRKGIVKDKVYDLELESTQITTPEGPEISLGDPSAPPPLPGIDLGPPAGGDMGMGDLGPALSELSINDLDAPIKAQNAIKSSSNFLNEEEEKENMTEFEKWQEKEGKKYKKKRKKAMHKMDAGVEDIASYKGNDGKFDVSGMPRLMSDLGQLKNPVKNLGKLNEEDFDIGEYLDTKITQSAKMTGTIKSTLSRFDTEFGKIRANIKNNIIISENNSSDKEENND